MDSQGEPPLRSFDYDLLVIGGGSGGLAVAKVSVSVSLQSALKYSGEITRWGFNLFLFAVICYCT